ncbi:MAG TPA: hypothetical protein ENN22_10160 [bacterium]|nr:hypothetical protein [bacterium]
MEDTCKNHPDRQAKRRCYYCKQPICTECQKNISHHLFCNRGCYFRYLLQQAWQKMNAAASAISRFLTRYYKELKKEPAFLVTFSILFVGLVLSISLSLFSIGQVKKLTQTIDQLNRALTAPDTATSLEDIARQIDTLTVFAPPAPVMVIKNQIDIEGEAEENRVITLSADGQLLEAKLVKAGRFAFRDVPVNAGKNRFVVRALSEDGTSIILEEIIFKYSPPTPSYLARDFTRGDLSEPKIAITFDGDYLDNITTEILDVLKQENIRCTFFLTGRFVRRYSDHIRRMVADGHEVGNHTWTHPHLTTYETNRKHDTRPGINREIVQQQLLKTAELFRQITGESMKPYWRAPYGEHNAEIRQWAAEAGFRQIGWTVGRDWHDGMDTMDWVADTTASYYYSADEIAEKILSFGIRKSNGANGAIILMHLGTLRQSDYPHEKLPYIIQQMKKQGYQFVSISEML